MRLLSVPGSRLPAEGCGKILGRNIVDCGSLILLTKVMEFFDFVKKTVADVGVSWYNNRKLKAD